MDDERRAPYIDTAKKISESTEYKEMRIKYNASRKTKHKIDYVPKSSTLSTYINETGSLVELVKKMKEPKV